MKFFSSTSSSTSSTSNTNPSIPKNAISGGLVGMLRRLLCFDALPTYYPFDRNTEFSNEENKRYGELDHDKEEELHTGNPGIVGRLMGLDSMPEVDLGGTQMRLNSITRNRSMNYADNLREELGDGKHRRIKSTLSFREAPPFVEIETEEFFILSFEGEGKDNDLMLKTRKSEKGHGEMKQRRREKCRNRNRNGYESDKENSAPKMVLKDVSGSEVEDISKILRPTSKLNIHSDVGKEVLKQANPISQRQSGERRRTRKKRNNNYCSPVQKVEIQSNSENSSPVSVLDFGDSPPEPEVLSSGGDLRLSNSNFRRRLPGELGTESYKHLSSITTSNSTSNDGKADISEAKRLQSWKKDREFQNYAEMWKEIGKLTKLETMELNRMYREPRQLEEFKDIGSVIGLEILDQLISEFLEFLTSKQDIFELSY